jgi:hypothetical protein
VLLDFGSKISKTKILTLHLSLLHSELLCTHQSSTVVVYSCPAAVPPPPSPRSPRSYWRWQEMHRGAGAAVLVQKVKRRATALYRPSTPAHRPSHHSAAMPWTCSFCEYVTTHFNF